MTFEREHAWRYLLLAALLLFVVLFQVPASLGTIRAQRSLDFYIPFLVRPFTSVVTDVCNDMNWEQGRVSAAGRRSFAVLRAGDRLIEVNGRPFTGMSLYLRELWKMQHQSHPDPARSVGFTAKVLARDGVLRTIESGVPHCTCGIPALWQAVLVWLAAPFFCILTGFMTAAMRPSSLLAWTFLALTLSLSQLQFWHEPYTGFQLTVTPMLLDAPFRVPAVAYRSFAQNAWPAFLLMAARQLAGGARCGSPLLRFLIFGFFAFAGLKMALAIAWSENFQILSRLHHASEEYRTESIVVALLSMAPLAWRGSRRAGIAATSIGIGSAVVIFAAPVKPEFVLVVAVAALLLAGAIAFLEILSWRPLVGLLCCIPLTVHVAASVGDYWWAFGSPSFPSWPWLVLATAGCGLAWTGRWIVQRESLSGRASQ